ncbi:MAG: crossover junction endodeoxyribonuclease RuvC [Alphaproteobacteria bacterium]|nr:crossover junction endodeoxyribonuclease RuvC [Alphaproteobacteria bacterium]
MRILGLDPGLRCTGWGIIEIEGNKLHHIAHGFIKTDEKTILPERLKALYHELQNIIQQYHPHQAAVEETYVNKNPQSTLKLGEARGVVLLAPASLGIPVAEYAANRIKKALVGVGHASKAQVMMMVNYLLPACGNLTEDAADALAIAICHGHYYTSPLV